MIIESHASIKRMLERSTRHVFSADDFRGWMDKVAMQIFGLKSEEFLVAYHEGRFAGIAVASYIASVESLINQ